MEIDNKFHIGQPVFIVHDPNQEERMITEISINANGLQYKASISTTESWHYAMELSSSIDIVKRTNG